MSKFKNINPTIIVIFGGTGDLAKRKLFPAFQNLYLDGRMAKKFQIIALGRAEKSDEEFRSYVLENLEIFSRKKGVSDPETQKFLSHISYHSLDIGKEEDYKSLNEKINDIDTSFGERTNRLFYLSITPSFITTISSNIKKIGLAENPKQDRIIIEKPFGYDKTSAIALNEMLLQTFKEEQIYRIDHYLGKETVQNILAFRFGNSMLNLYGAVTLLILFKLQ